MDHPEICKEAIASEDDKKYMEDLLKDFKED